LPEIQGLAASANGQSAGMAMNAEPSGTPDGAREGVDLRRSNYFAPRRTVGGDKDKARRSVEQLILPEAAGKD